MHERFIAAIRLWYSKIIPLEQRYLFYQFRWWLKLCLQGQWKRCMILGYAIIVRFYDDACLLLHNRKKVECPICGWQGNRFFILTNLGHNVWQRVLCPRCACLDRHRVLFLYLKRKLCIENKPFTVLDVAPMKGLQDYCRRMPNITYLSVDFRSPLAMTKMDITALGLASGVFDLAICFHVLEHVRNDALAIAELLRTLKEGGLAIVDVPLDWDNPITVEYGTAEPIHGHYRLYGLDFMERLRKAGFKVSIDDFALRLNPLEKKRYGLWEMRLIIARKNA